MSTTPGINGANLATPAPALERTISNLTNSGDRLAHGLQRIEDAINRIAGHEPQEVGKPQEVVPSVSSALDALFRLECGANFFADRAHALADRLNKII